MCGGGRGGGEEGVGRGRCGGRWGGTVQQNKRSLSCCHNQFLTKDSYMVHVLQLHYYHIPICWVTWNAMGYRLSIHPGALY